MLSHTNNSIMNTSCLLLGQLIPCGNSELVALAEVVLPIRGFEDLLTVGGNLWLELTRFQTLDEAGVALGCRSLAAESIAIYAFSVQPLLDLSLQHSLLSDSVLYSLGCSEVCSIFGELKGVDGASLGRFAIALNYAE